VRPVVTLQIVKLQIARHYGGAQKIGGISETRYKSENDNHGDEMGDSGICTRHDHVSGLMREEGRSAATPAAARAYGSHGLAVGEPEHS